MGSSNKTPVKTATAAPAAPTQPPIQTMTMDAFMPGQQGLLAQQMAAGGYGTVDENMGLLGRTYAPSTIPIITKPSDVDTYIKQLAAAGTSPATGSNGSTGGASPSSGVGRTGNAPIGGLLGELFNKARAPKPDGWTAPMQMRPNSVYGRRDANTTRGG